MVEAAPAPRSPLGPIPLRAIRAARERIKDAAMRSPLIELEAAREVQVFAKLENLQAIGSFKLRGAGNAMALAGPAALARGVYTASAGNMAQGVAWNARRRGIECAVIVPDHAPATKLDAIDRLGARIVKVPFSEWWQVLIDHGHPDFDGLFIHPFADPAVIAGNGTIGLEIVEDMPDVDAVLVPFGGGGLSCGIAAAIRGIRPEARVYGCEVETATPLRAAIAAGRAVESPRQQTFVDGIGAPTVLREMWPAAHRLLAGSLVVSLSEVAAAIRLLVQRAAVVAEGAGAASVAAGWKRLAGDGRVVCVVSGGNIDQSVLSRILAGEVP